MGPTSRLTARWRELAILRIGWLCNSKYEWNQHVWIAEDAGGPLNGPGFSMADFRAVEQGPDSPYWSEPERLVLEATDELRASCFISDATWAMCPDIKGFDIFCRRRLAIKFADGKLAVTTRDRKNVVESRLLFSQEKLQIYYPVLERLEVYPSSSIGGGGADAGAAAACWRMEES